MAHVLQHDDGWCWENSCPCKHRIVNVAHDFLDDFQPDPSNEKSASMQLYFRRIIFLRFKWKCLPFEFPEYKRNTNICQEAHTNTPTHSRIIPTVQLKINLCFIYEYARCLRRWHHSESIMLTHTQTRYFSAGQMQQTQAGEKGFVNVCVYVCV